MLYLKASAVYGSYLCLKTRMIYMRKDYENYAKLMLKTNTLHRGNFREVFYPKSSRGEKCVRLLSPIWRNRREYEGKGAVIITSDPDALLKRLDLLLASKEETG